MGSPFTDRTYLWVVWQRGDKPTKVREVMGYYASRADALDEAYRVGADGLTPIKDRVLSDILRMTSPALVERSLRGVAAAAK